MGGGGESNASVHIFPTHRKRFTFAGQTVTQLFTVPHDRKRKREEAAKAAAKAAELQQGSPAAAANDGQSSPRTQFSASHYVLSHKVGGKRSRDMFEDSCVTVSWASSAMLLELWRWILGCLPVKLLGLAQHTGCAQQAP